MIYYELAILGGIFILALVAMAAFGRPMAEAYAEKLRVESTSRPETDKTEKLEARVKELESQVDDLTKQLIGMQETLDFTVKLVEKESADV